MIVNCIQISVDEMIEKKETHSISENKKGPEFSGLFLCSKSLLRGYKMAAISFR